jgi:hypothetical protein
MLRPVTSLARLVAPPAGKDVGGSKSESPDE